MSSIRAGRLRDRLGERDLAVLGSLAALRLLTTVQLQRLHVTDGAPETRARRARALLRRLSQLGVVVRLERRVGGVRAGSAGQVYGLSGLGQAVLGVGGPLGRRRRTVWTTKPAFADHVLEVGELNVRLVELTRNTSSSAELLVFDGEPGCWRRFSGAGGQTVTLKPDAFLAVGLGELEQRAFIEMDLGSESLPTISRKCQCYLAYFQTGREQHEHGVFPRVWWLASNERRLHGIAKVVARLARGAQALFTVALTNEAPTLLTQLPGPGGAA